MRNPTACIRARNLRHHSTDAERYLWKFLRRRYIDGHRFRRQVPLGKYIADFACVEARLVVEIDGGQHQAQSGYDAERDRAIAELGYRVLRFWNNDVMLRTEPVLETIREALIEKTNKPPS